MRRRMTAMLKAPVFVAGLVVLTSCIDSWDDVGPSDWYSSAAGDDYPELGAIPDEPVNVSTPEEIDQVAQALAANLADAQYTSDIVRADDETIPAEIRIPETTIAEAGTVGVPVESRIETETIRDAEGELAGSVTTVVETSLVSGDENEADMMMAVAAEMNDAPDFEPMVEVVEVAPAPEPFAVPKPVAVAGLSTPPLELGDVGGDTFDDGSTSLVALSERTDADTISVVPDYVAAPDISTPEPVTDVAAVGSPTTTVNDATFTTVPDISTSEPVTDVAAVGSPTTTVNNATFTTAGNAGLGLQTLAAILRFGNGSSSLGADERRIVAQLAAIHAQTGGAIRLIGHASKSGGNLQSTDAALVNFKISLDRATAVARELIRNGVPEADILIEAAAAMDSMAADAGIENEAVDRRVEVYFGA